MTKTPKICPRCAAFLKKGTTKCPECGKSFVDEIEKVKAQTEVNVTTNAIVDVKLSSGKNKKEKKKKVYNHKAVKLGVEVKTDKAGQLEIDTTDVTFIKPSASRSVKEARGDTIPEKLKWWEIYKWADRMLARRKIKKYVNKAATEIPPHVSNVKMFFLCLFLGWFGVHNLYAKNYVRGFVVMSFTSIAVTVISVAVLNKIMGVSVGGGLGFVVLFMWALDFYRILAKKYKYRVSQEKFINTLNFSTRAQLG